MIIVDEPLADQVFIIADMLIERHESIDLVPAEVVQEHQAEHNRVDASVGPDECLVAHAQRRQEGVHRDVRNGQQETESENAGHGNLANDHLEGGVWQAVQVDLE